MPIKMTIKLMNTFTSQGESPYNIHFEQFRINKPKPIAEGILPPQESSGTPGFPPHIKLLLGDDLYIWAQDKEGVYKTCPFIIPMPDREPFSEFPFTVRYDVREVEDEGKKKYRKEWCVRLNLLLYKRISKPPENINVNVGDDKQ